ncbi:MAG: hypothetical protein FWG72_01890 [Oscillospiraceae bacterium]|nr:hypothetical protein [Oscillospiraceae bacterium]
MDFGSRKTKSAAQSRDIEILNLTGDSVRFEPSHDRVARILRLARDRNEANALPDKLCRLAFMLFALFAAAGLLVWGLVFRNATLVLAFWFALSVFAALPVLLTVYIRQAFGVASRLHKFHSPALTLAPDRVILEMKRNALFRGKHSPSIRREFLYSRMSRLEYDRSTKTLRVSSAGSPSATMDIVLFYDNPDAIVREIEKRGGVFIHPAMRGDDYADLRDLPGLKREFNLLRPMSAAVLAFCLASLMTVLAIRTHNQNNPYLPYPRTQEMFLIGRFGVGDTVTLDGCDVTLNDVTRVGSDARGVCYQFLLTLHNGNDSAVRLRVEDAYKDSPGNIQFSAVTAEGKTVPLQTAPPPPGHVGVNLLPPPRLPPHKNISVTFFLWVPDAAAAVELTLNSDYWPPADVLRDVTYSGHYVDIGGIVYKSNETRFVVGRNVLG